MALLSLGARLMASIASIAAEAPTVFPIRQNDPCELIDREGKVIVPVEFQQPLRLQDGLIMASKGTRTAFFDATAKMVSRPQDQTRGPFSEGLAPAYIPDTAGKGTIGYVDHALRPVIRGNFRDAGPFSDGMADVSVADECGVVKRGYIERTGKLVIPARYDKTFPFSGGLGRVAVKDAMRLLDKAGRDVTPEGIDFIGIQAEGIIRVWNGRIVWRAE